MKNELYEFWLQNSPLRTKKTLELLTNEAISVAFSKNLSFGTAGIRAPMGLGTNFINEFIVAKVALAYGKWLLTTYGNEAKKHGIVIAHDNRLNGKKFSVIMAQVIMELGIPVYLFAKNLPQPTPLLSFTITNNPFVGGINLTASHNPPIYNGIKVYNKIGYQLLPKDTELVERYLQEISNPFTIKQSSKRCRYLSTRYEDNFLQQIKQSIPFDLPVKKKRLKIIFTANNGTATKLAKKLLKFSRVEFYFVTEQSKPDENFKNTPFPNPQDYQSFDLAKKYGDKYDADVLFGTDPDADRFGVVVKNRRTGKWVHLDGNELANLQFYYKLTRLSELKLLDSKRDFAVRSIVSSQAGDAIAKLFSIQLHYSLTGFKWIVSEALQLEDQTGGQLIFAWEESYGSIISLFTHDKDSFQALVQVCELFNYYSLQNKTIFDVFDELYQKIGFYRSDQIKKIFTNTANNLSMERFIDRFRNYKIGDKIATFSITKIIDLLPGYQNLASDNTLFLFLDNRHFVALRPSGTEPVLRIYFDVCAKNSLEASEILQTLKTFFA